jgi:hypothetical protein
MIPQFIMYVMPLPNPDFRASNHSNRDPQNPTLNQRPLTFHLRRQLRTAIQEPIREQDEVDKSFV